MVFLEGILAGEQLKKVDIEWYDDNAITVVLCAKGYPGNYIKDSEIKNIDKVKTDKNNQVFHAGTYKKNNRVDVLLLLLYNTF